MFHPHNKLSAVEQVEREEEGEMVIKHLGVELPARLLISMLRTNRASLLWITRAHLPAGEVVSLEEEVPLGGVRPLILLEECQGAVNGVGSRLAVEDNEEPDEVGEIGKR